MACARAGGGWAVVAAMEEEEEGEGAHVETKVWRPGVDELAEGEGQSVGLVCFVGA